jgi:uncharacterized membrane protein YciS (DUF1049 family)
MKRKKMRTLGCALLIFMIILPITSAQNIQLVNKNHMVLTNIQITGYNATIFTAGLLFNKNHSGLCILMKIWTQEDGHAEISRIGNPSNEIVLDGNLTITLFGFIGYAVAGGNCSSGHCDPMDVHGKVLIATWGP